MGGERTATGKRNERNSAGVVRFGGWGTDKEERGAKKRPGRRQVETRLQGGGRGKSGGRFSGAGGGFWLVSVGRGVAYWQRAARETFLPPAEEHTGPVSDFSTANPLSQAALNPKSLHFFDETEPHARDALRRVFFHVLFRGVVTPGFGMNESRAFLTELSPKTNYSQWRNQSWQPFTELPRRNAPPAAGGTGSAESTSAPISPSTSRPPAFPPPASPNVPPPPPQTRACAGLHGRRFCHRLASHAVQVFRNQSQIMK